MQDDLGLDDAASRIAAVSDGRTTISFSHPAGSGMVETLTVSVAAPYLSAQRSVYVGWSTGFATLAQFFSKLVSDWRGWAGDRVYETIEGDLRFVATHTGHIRLEVTMRESERPRGWRVDASLEIEPGEQLSQFVSEFNDLVLGFEGR